MKRFTGQTRQSELSDLANNVSNGSLHNLAEAINLSLIAVSDDLHPLQPAMTPSRPVIQLHQSILFFPETACFPPSGNINVRKAPGPDDLPNWVYVTTHHYCANRFVRYLIPASSKGLARMSGK